MKVDGACHCGSIKFEAEIDPDRVRICHCTDCQSLSGTAFRMTAPVPEADFRLLSGSPKIYIKTSQSGTKRAQVFCRDCGAPLYTTTPEGQNRTFGLRVGALRQRAELPPKRQYWARSKLPWLPELPGTSHEQQ
ncbi:aldehyde-activating protein [Devosia pacifica]|uniref:Aldehyde-activating protein n=1 Tax=Devosia pacifica TaxID=1335967 RepID=A0A918S3J6_9HYPH|nr:GFA family protein [Devosia pacifica]GHA23208.1 aldehyde-activating protein [Devosia pacifica]